MQNILEDLKIGPKEFLYGASEGLLNQDYDYVFIPRGERTTFLRKTLGQFEKIFTKTYVLGCPTELILENWDKVRKSSLLFGINDAISISILMFKFFRLLNVPCITLFQSLTERRIKYFSNNKLAIWFMSKLLAKSDLVLTLSDAAKDDLIRYFKVLPSKVEVFRFGADIDFWMYKDYSNREDYILAVGNDGNRDYETLINVVGTKYKLKMVTSKNLGNLPGNIEILRDVSNEKLRYLYQRARLVVTPSSFVKTESCGLSTTLQAMACGAAVLVSDSTPMRETFIQNKHVFYFKPESEVALKAELDKIYIDKSKLERVGSSSRRLIELKYNNKNMELFLRNSVNKIKSQYFST